MTIYENVAFGLEARGAAKEEVRDRVAAMLALVDLGPLAGRRVSEISGGQQQRVALARALAPAPRLLLLDEPLSNLDPSLRERTREELRAAVKKVGITTVLVTHEQEEAFHVGDRVAVLHQGRLEQLGRPLELYQHPATRFVAGFVGRSSRLPGKFVSILGEGMPAGSPLLELAHVELQGGGGRLFVEGRLEESARPPAAPPAAGTPIEVFLRPESFELKPSGYGLPEGRVQEMRFTGPATYAIVAIEGLGRAEVLVGPDEDLTGRTVAVGWRRQGPQPALFLVNGLADGLADGPAAA
jgi:ABC-type Fe3+/spermidine/putrescine transport system ATPase subunit